MYDNFVLNEKLPLFGTCTGVKFSRYVLIVVSFSFIECMLFIYGGNILMG